MHYHHTCFFMNADMGWHCWYCCRAALGPGPDSANAGRDSDTQRSNSDDIGDRSVVSRLRHSKILNEDCWQRLRDGIYFP